MTRERIFFGERLGSRDGAGWTLLTRQIAFEPLPASVLFALGLADGGVLGDVVVILIPDSLILVLRELQ